MEFQTRRSQDYHYQLVPQTSGGLTIGSFRVKVDGKQYSTNPLVVEVTLDPSQASPPSGSGLLEEPDEIEQMFNQMLQRHRLPAQPKVIPRNLNESFFIHVDADKTEAYVGEQITVNWYLYTKGQILSLDRLKFPDLKGFWKEIIEEVPALNFTSEAINGVMYRRALLASHALFPIKEGTAIIDEYKVKATVQVPTRSFGGFSFSEPYSYQRSSDRVEIKVKPLPKEGQPPNFSGAVGFFEVTSSVTDTQVPINQPFALKLRFDGQGNAKLIDLPEVKWPDGLEYFEQKSEARFFKNGRSFREFEILLIPRKNGEIELPSFTFAFFDPVNKRYYEKQTQPIRVNVTGEAKTFAVKEESDTTTSVEPEKWTLPPLSSSPLDEQVTFIHFLPGIFRSLSLWCLGLGFISIAFVCYLELIRVDKKQTWKEYLDARLKLMEKRSSQAMDPDEATFMTQTLSKLVGAVSQEGLSSQEFGKLLSQSPPSLQSQIGSELLQFYRNLELVAYAPKEQRIQDQSFQDYFSHFKSLSYKILSYLES
jgi:hypothetical protein